MLKIYEKSRLYKLPETEAQAIKHKEKIKAKFLFVVASQLEAQKELLEMLDKICMALKLQENEVEYLWIKGQIHLSEYASAYQGKNVLCFGFKAEDLMLNMELKAYHPYVFQGYNLLLANNLMDVYENQSLKAKLWANLQQMNK
ncbi:MAG: hypothetical protein KDC82_04055 [Bacteroidetes bacterium]|nr:hypothetical protein [Bacteroidota bacterium]